MALTGPERVLLDGVDLKTYAKNTPSLGGNLTTPGRRGSNVPTAGRSGAVYTGNKPFEQGEFTLTLWVRGTDDDGKVPTGSTSRIEFMKRVDELVALFTKGQGLSTLRHVLPDGSARSIDVECVRAQNWSVDGPDPLGRVDFDLVAPGSFWYGDALSTNLNPNTTNAIFTGTAPLDDATYTITGPITNPTITDATTGSYFRYGATVAAGQTLIVNSGSWSLAASGGLTPSLAAVTTTGMQGRLMRLLPDNVARVYRVGLSGTSTTAATRLTVAGRPKFLNG